MPYRSCRNFSILIFSRAERKIHGVLAFAIQLCFRSSSERFSRVAGDLQMIGCILLLEVVLVLADERVSVDLVKDQKNRFIARPDLLQGLLHHVDLLLEIRM